MCAILWLFKVLAPAKEIDTVANNESFILNPEVVQISTRTIWIWIYAEQNSSKFSRQ